MRPQDLRCLLGGANEVYFGVPSGETPSSIATITIRASARLDIDYYHNADITANGTDMTISNFKTDETGETPLTFEYGGDYTTGTLAAESLIPGGRGQQALGAQTSNVRAQVAEGDSVRIEFNNPGTSDNDVAVIIVFLEEPVKEI